MRRGTFIRYHGGKHRIAPKLIAMMPPTLGYIEPFGGGASVLLHRDRIKLEVYNDMNGDMVAMFRAVRDHGPELAQKILLTPYAREEFESARDFQTDCDVERARRMLVRSHMGFGGKGLYKSTGFRGNGMRSGSLPCHVWAKLPEIVEETCTRMRGVVIENKPAIEVLKYYDGENVLHYVDPPYVHSTRNIKHRYQHEMNDEEHFKLVEELLRLKGKVVLSGYAHQIYDEALSGWRRVEFEVMADGARPRVEVVWMNYDDDMPLFQTG